MAALTFFLATSPIKKLLTKDEIESLILALLHEKHIKLPAAIFVGKALNEVRDEEYWAAMKEKTLLHASQYIIPNSPEDMLNLAKAIAEKGKNPPAPDTLWWFGRQ